jgi:superfamily II DNA/RNA helicase
MPPVIQRIADTFLHNPVRVEVSRPATTATTIKQMLVATGREDFEKRETLRQLIRTAENFKNAIVFCNRKREVATLHRSLLRHKFNAVALHGDMDQAARTAALDAFRRGDAKLLIASDVAARGLDIPDVSHVFNFDVPHHPDDYVHRVGRTGRAGKSGIAITIAAPADFKAVAAIEKLIGQPIPPSGEPLKAEPREHKDGAEAPRRGGRQRGRRSGQSQARPQPVASRSSDRPSERPSEPRLHRERRPERETAPDASHLPAFLLRPVTVKA